MCGKKAEIVQLLTLPEKTSRNKNYTNWMIFTHGFKQKIKISLRDEVFAHGKKNDNIDLVKENVKHGIN